MVADLPVILPNELLAQLNVLALLVCGEVPEPILVCSPERVDEHQTTFRVHRKLLLSIDVDKAPPTDRGIQRFIDSQDGFQESVVLRRCEARDADRLVPSELPVHLLELRRRLDERFG